MGPFDKLRNPGRYGIAMGGGKGGGGGTTQTVQKSDPWSGQQDYLKDIFSRAQEFGTDPTKAPQYYPTSTVASMNPYETQAIQGLSDFGQSGGSAGLQASDAQIAKTANGDYLNQGNPYQDAVNKSIMATVMPQLTAQFTQGNNMNNPAAAYAVSQGVGSAIANSQYGNYQQERQNQLDAAKNAALTSTAQQQALQGGLAAGQTQQEQAQNELNDLVNRYNYNQNLPQQQLNYYSALVNNGTYGGTTTSQQPYYSNSAANTLGTLGNLGTLGYLGYLAFSDRRLKENIQKIGVLPSGLNLYRYNYIGDKSEQVGVMADEVIKVKPHAVMSNGLGYLMVNYAKLLD